MTEPEFRYSDLLPSGPDETPYRLLTAEGVSTQEVGGRTFLTVEPSVLRMLTAEAMHDIAHYLRPAHLAQLRRIIDDLRPGALESADLLSLVRARAEHLTATTPVCVRVVAPEHLTVAGRLRIEHRQASLEELGQLANPPLTKDAIAGRIRRLLAMADKRAEELGIPDTEASLTPEMLEEG